MDHMRISGTEPSSAILRQTKYFQKYNSIVISIGIIFNEKEMQIFKSKHWNLW